MKKNDNMQQLQDTFEDSLNFPRNTKRLLKFATKKQREQAYEKAKEETLKKYPNMVKFFEFLETQKTSKNTGEETPIKSELKGVDKE